MQFVKPEERYTSPLMTKYEVAAVIGIRAEELVRGIPPAVEVPPELVGKYEKIARLELLAHAIPYYIYRRRPSDGRYESWCIYDHPTNKKIHCEMIIFDYGDAL